MAKQRKKFWNIEVPLLKRTITLYSYTQESLIGRTVKLDLTRELRGKSLEAVFKVEKDKDKLTAVPTKLSLMKFYIIRMMRKSTSYVEDSFSADCKNAKLRIKPFLITRKKVSRSVRKALREKIKEEIKSEINNKKYESVFQEIVENRFQRPLSLKLKKIYPLALCEIREIKLEKLTEKPKKEDIKVKTEKVEENK